MLRMVDRHAVQKLMGTPNYMAPEQIDSVSNVDGRADLYAAGMMTWEMLTGERPLSNETLFNVIFKQKMEDLESLRSRRPELPNVLIQVWRKVTRRDADDRWGTADEMLEMLSEAGRDGDLRVNGNAEPATDSSGGTRTPSSRSDHPADSGSEPTRRWNG